MEEERAKDERQEEGEKKEGKIRRGVKRRIPPIGVERGESARQHIRQVSKQLKYHPTLIVGADLITPRFIH